MKFFNNHKLATVLCLSAFFGCFFFPLEEDLHGHWVPFYFVLKMLGCYAWTLLSLWGMGGVLSEILFKISSSQFFRRAQDQDSSYQDRMIRFFFNAFLGIFLVGLCTFLIGLGIPPQRFQAIAISILGIFFAFLQREHLFVLSRDVKVIFLSFLDKKSQIVLSFLTVMVVARTFSVFDFQGHEDSYLYHLALAERWIDLGHTGIILDNITSGYSLSIEHCYLFLKLLVQGNAEQNALAQLLHGTIGFGTFVSIFYFISRKFLERMWSLVFLAFFLQPKFLAFSLLPKNDAFVLAIAPMSLWGLMSKKDGYLWGAALLACTVKITTVVQLVSLGLVYPIFYATNKKEWYGYIKVLLFAAFLCVLGFFPFAVHNFVMTKNPVFPLLNNIFNSPFAPSSMQSIVQEMAPFSLNMESLIDSLFALLKSQFIFPLGLSLFIVQCLRKKVQSNQLVLFISILSMFNFLLLLLCLGPYGSRIEDRHFIFPLACFVFLALLAIYHSVKNGPYQRRAFFAIFIVALSISHFDTSVRSFFEFFQKPQLTADLFSRKSLIKMISDISSLKQKNVKILALTGSNTSYFLEHGIFWHKSISFPVLFWEFDHMSEDEWRYKIKENSITHLIVPKKSQEIPVHLNKLLMHKINEGRNEDLYDVSYIFSSENK